MDAQVVAAIITTGGVIYAATVGWFFRQINQTKKQHKEQIAEAERIAIEKAEAQKRQAFHDAVTNPYFPVREWTNFVWEVQKLHAETEVDRFLVLVAVNGEDDPTHASVVWEHRTEGERYVYQDVSLDSHYVSLLMALKRGERVAFLTSEVKNTLIGKYYETEGVQQSIWRLVGKRVSYSTPQVAYKFVSVATHREGGFSNLADIERRVSILLGDFKPMLHVAGFGPV